MWAKEKKNTNKYSFLDEIAQVSRAWTEPE